MIVGVGIDLVEVARVRALLDRFPDRAAGRLFTRREREACERRARPVECYAARFAAKEALLKALGVGLTGGIRWRDIEVRADAAGNPHLELSGRALEALRERGGRRLHLSFTHDGGGAAAVVVVEGAERA